MGGKERVELDELKKSALVNLREPRRFAGDNGGDAWRLIDERHLAEDGTTGGILDNFVPDHDDHGTFEQNKHGVTWIARLEKRFAGREVRRVAFAGE